MHLLCVRRKRNNLQQCETENYENCLPYGYSPCIGLSARRRDCLNAADYGQSSLLASLAPSVKAASFAQAICGWTRPPNPQSVPAITFSRPTI